MESMSNSTTPTTRRPDLLGDPIVETDSGLTYMNDTTGGHLIASNDVTGGRQRVYLSVTGGAILLDTDQITRLIEILQEGRS